MRPPLGPGRRVDPFVLPSGTASRFGLLIVAVSAAVSSFGQSLTGPLLGFGGDGTVRGEESLACLQRLAAEARRQPDPSRGWDLDGCHYPSTWIPGDEVAALGVFWLLVLALYWFLPVWRIRRRGLVPLPSAGTAELRAELERLRREAGLGTPVVFLLGPLDPRPSGLAFGRAGRRYVVLSAGLVALRTRDPEVFRAVVRHELAHIRNRDIDITFVTVAVWRVFLVLGLIPIGLLLLAIFLLDPSDPDILTERLLWTTLLFTGLVTLARNAVLRTRELHADARASLAEGGREGLARLFASAPAPAVRGWPRGALSAHPTAAERLAALSDSRPLLVLGFWEALAMGLAVSLAHDGTTSLSAGLLRTSIGGPVPDLFFAVLLAVGVGLGAWRTALYAWRGGSPADGGAIGAGLGAGLALGKTVSERHADVSASMLQYPITLTLFFWAVLMVITGRLVTRWLVETGRAWLEAEAVRGRPRPGRPIVLGGVAVAAAWIALWLTVMFPVAETAVYVSALLMPGAPIGLVLLTAFAMCAVGVLQPVPQLLVVLGAALLPLLARGPGHRPGEAVRLGVRTATWAALLVTGCQGAVLLADDRAAPAEGWWSLTLPALAAALLAGAVSALREGRAPVAHAVVAACAAGLATLGAGAVGLRGLACAVGAPACAAPFDGDGLQAIVRLLGILLVVTAVLAKAIEAVRRRW